jgi:hypothetical protein
MAVCSFPGLVPVFWFRHQKGYTAFTLLHTFRGYLVGGSPGGHLDDQCAQAALDRIKDRLK